jgi:RNA polymerase sigma factor, sigma-70 family
LQEEELINDAKEGNKNSMNILLQQNYKMLFGFVIKMTADEVLSEDITQETLLKAVLNIKKFKGGCKFSTWLIQISINLYKDYLRKNKAMDTRENLDFIKEEYTIEDKVISSIQLKEALEFLKGMPEKKRIAFILKHYYGYSLEEIAKIMDCPTGTVKSRINNCISVMKSTFLRDKELL